MRLRVVIAAVGVLAAAYGVMSLLTEDLGDLVNAGLWLGGGVVLHDFVLTPVLLALGFVSGRWLPERLHTPLAAAAIALGSVTLLAVPVLGRFGARTDNPTLLDRPYAAGWLALVALVLLGVVGHLVLQRLRPSRRRGGVDGPGSGR